MKPQPVTDLDLAFGGDMDKLMPPNLRKIDPYSIAEKWNKFQSDWFFLGLDAASLKVTPKEGIDVQTALAHLNAIQRSFSPKHEDKTLAVAYLASIWFEDVSYKTRRDIKDLIK